MVDRTDGQFYTMEGMAAAVLMVFTAYLVMSTTTVYTPGDTHIIDMQLEQIGNDALKIMDMKDNSSDNRTNLEKYIYNIDRNGYSTEFNETINAGLFSTNPIHFKADIYYINISGVINSSPFIESSRKFSGNENAVRVSRWVFVNSGSKSFASDYNTSRNQTVLLEVLLWRG